MKHCILSVMGSGTNFVKWFLRSTKCPIYLEHILEPEFIYRGLFNMENTLFHMPLRDPVLSIITNQVLNRTPIPTEKTWEELLRVESQIDYFWPVAQMSNAPRNHRVQDDHVYKVAYRQGDWTKLRHQIDSVWPYADFWLRHGVSLPWYNGT